MVVIKSENFDFLRELNLNHKAESVDVREFIVEMDAGRWSSIIETKKRFLYYGEDLYNKPYIYPEIADSWIRSKKFGVNPSQEKLGFILNSKELHTLILDKWDLVSITNDIMIRNLNLLSLSNYLMCLTDENGILLLSAGGKNIIESFEAINAVPGAVWTEKQIGTNCHSMCINLRKPVQIMGPYYYCDIVNDNVGSGTPIMDDNGNILGVLLVVTVSTPEKQVRQTNLLSWVISAGLAIENKLRLQKKNYMLSLTDTSGIFDETYVQEGRIILDKEKRIYHIDRQIAQSLGIERKEAIDLYYSKVLKFYLPIEEALEQKEPINKYQVSLTRGNMRKTYDIDIEPIINDESKEVSGLVIKFLCNKKKNIVQEKKEEDVDAFDPIIGSSKSLQTVIQKARKVACRDGSVLLQGESGTGKELFAKAIHDQSKRKGDFIAINCASIPRSIIESELFGYEGGAFTGAERKGKIGKIELARGGTLFLDEIGDMPLDMQAVLLRVLEDKRIMRVGGTKYIPVDFRVIAATNKDLREMVFNKTFREDLYFRLAVFKLTIPSLSSRDDDVLELADYFIKKLCRKDNISEYPRLSEEVCELFLKYEWPGNVRQLENVITYALAMVNGKTIKISHLPEDLKDAVKYNRSKDKTKCHDKLSNIEKMEREAIKDAMKKSGNNVKQAADLLGLGRSTVYRKIKQYKIKI